MSLEKVLVTGATGFIGAAVVKKLVTLLGIQVWAGARDSVNEFPEKVISFPLGDIGRSTSCGSLSGISTIVHCAARVPVIEARCPIEDFREVNVNGTLKLARRASQDGVRRFIFISSVKVNGEATSLGRPYHAHDAPSPQDPYGLSKLEAEQGILAVAEETGLEVVIIRPPLVYGPSVKGNFANMIKLVDHGIPLPLGAIHNKRSLVGIDNLVDLIIRCIEHPAAANQLFLASDGEDLSTTELLRSVGNAMGKPVRLIPVPAGLLQLGATILGKRAMAQRLLGSLQVDISKTCELLDWKPPYTVEEGLKRCFERSN